MNHAEIQEFKRVLESRRDEACHRLNRLSDETRSLDHDARDSGDQSIATISREALFQQNSQRRNQLRSIEAALARIQDGTFGICETCSHEIAPRRLQAVPWTDHCIRCQEMREREASPHLDRGLEEVGWRRAS